MHMRSRVGGRGLKCRRQIRASLLYNIRTEPRDIRRASPDYFSPAGTPAL